MNTPKMPPRLIVPRDEVYAEGGFGTYFAVWTPDDPFVTNPAEDIEYLSITEHQAIIEAALSEIAKQLQLAIDGMGHSFYRSQLTDLQKRITNGKV